MTDIKQTCCKNPHDCSNPLSPECLYKVENMTLLQPDPSFGWRRTDDIPFSGGPDEEKVCGVFSQDFDPLKKKPVPVGAILPAPTSDEMPNG